MKTFIDLNLSVNPTAHIYPPDLALFLGDTVAAVMWMRNPRARRHGLFDLARNPWTLKDPDEEIMLVHVWAPKTPPSRGPLVFASLSTVGRTATNLRTIRLRDMVTVTFDHLKLEGDDFVEHLRTLQTLRAAAGV